jgi:uncharacterized protein YegJ (DUF2314 family)
MNAAIEKARATVGEFWHQFEKPDPGVSDFALKVKIKDPNGVEHFWLISIERGKRRHFGEVNNDPNTVKMVKLGDRYSFTDDEITDWSFMRNGKLVGNLTLRALLKHMPPDEAAKYRKLLEAP